MSRRAARAVDLVEDIGERLHRAASPAPPAKQARAFTPADKSLIKHTASFMPTLDLLRVLNDRMHADVGPDAPDYTLEQLRRQTAQYIGERLARTYDRLDLLATLVFNSGAGEMAPTLKPEHVRTLAGYLEDLRDDLADAIEEHDDAEAANG